MQESSCCAYGNCGAKGSVELQKNYALITKDTTKKFMNIQGFTLSGLISENEEEGAVISVVFQNCDEATKDIEQIIIMYDYNGAKKDTILNAQLSL